MKFLQRWTTSMISSVDAAVAKIENHEALINSAIADSRRNLSRAQVQLQRVRKDGKVLEAHLAEEQKAQKEWQERAVRCQEDEERALECLRRSKQAARTVAHLEQRRKEHCETENTLAADIEKLHNGLSELTEQRNLMCTRQSRAKAMVAIRDSQCRMRGDVEEILDRWEIHVAEDEIQGGCMIETGDRLKYDFEKEEEKDELRAELAKLREET